MLHDLHDRAGKVLADVAQPARHAGRRTAAPALAVLIQAVLAVRIVERGQRLIHLGRHARELAAAGFGFTAQDEAPAAQAGFVGEEGGNISEGLAHKVISRTFSAEKKLG